MWHQQIRITTRIDFAKLSIYVPGLCASNHNNMVDTVNCKFVNISSGLIPLGISIVFTCTQATHLVVSVTSVQCVAKG